MRFSVTQAELASYKLVLREKLKGQTNENTKIIRSMIGQFHKYAIQHDICTWKELVGLTNLCLRAPELLLSLYRVYGDAGITRFLSFAIKFRMVIPKLVELENELEEGDLHV